MSDQIYPQGRGGGRMFTRLKCLVHLSVETWRTKRAALERALRTELEDALPTHTHTPSHGYVHTRKPAHTETSKLVHTYTDTRARTPCSLREVLPSVTDLIYPSFYTCCLCVRVSVCCLPLRQCCLFCGSFL